MNELPLPDSPELDELLPTTLKKNIYRVLFENRDTPLTIAQIRQHLGLATGEQGQFDRRMRELYHVFEVERTQKGTNSFYRLIKKRDELLNTSQISLKLRAQVLKSGRCAQCGRTVAEDNVKLHADHKIPQAWGGTNDPENLQALCADCNEGKRDFYASYDKYAEEIRAAANYNEPHKRIGELLKAFNGEFVRPDLIEIVANAKQYQDDWQKRLRELRTLGWEIAVERRKEGKRIVAYYAVKHFEPWPDGNIRAEITRREVQGKSQNP